MNEAVLREAIKMNIVCPRCGSFNTSRKTLVSGNFNVATYRKVRHCNVCKEWF